MDLKITDPYEIWYNNRYQQTYWSPYVWEQQEANRAGKIGRPKAHKKAANIKDAKHRARVVAFRNSSEGRTVTINQLKRAAVDDIICVSNVRNLAGNSVLRRLGKPTATYYAGGRYRTSAYGWPLADVIEAVNHFVPDRSELQDSTTYDS